MAEMLIKEVLTTTGITATAGIGTNMYLAKVAMDITAKKMPADENGVRIAELDEMSYRRELWTHRPLTDFWMVGRGISKKLEDNYMFTMGDVARCSQYNEAKLYKLFGVNAELLIDRAWGREPTTIADVKAYRPSSNSLSMLSSFCRVSSTSAQTPQSSASSWQPSMSVRPLLLQRSM